MLSTQTGKAGKGSNILEEKINMYCPPQTEVRIRWNFATVSSTLRDALAKPLKKEEKEQN